MAQGIITVTDATGAQKSLVETVDGSGYYTPNILVTDESGNRIKAAPGGGAALLVSQDGTKACYDYAILAFAPVATPTDVVEIKGSATKTVRVRRISIGGVATAAGNMPVQLIRRSAADTNGGGMVKSAITAFKRDTTDAGATAVVSSIGTANPGGLGAQVGGIAAAGRAQLAAAGSGVAANDLVWEFGNGPKAIVLRGVLDFLYLNMNGAALPVGAVFDICITTEEDVS